MNFVEPIRSLKKIEEMKKELKKQSDRNYMIFVMGINTALRISDLLKLKVEDVRGKTHLNIKETKTNKIKKMIINESLKKEIEAYTEGKKDNDWLFPSRKGNQPISRIQAYRILNAVGQELGLDEIGTHTLRKTFGYFFYQSTKDIATLQQLLNHSAPSITMRYLGLHQDGMDEALKDFHL